MQWWRAALAALSLAAAAGIAEVAGGVAATNSGPVKKYDRETVLQLERGLLSLLGLQRRPPLLRKRAPVPEAMRALYEQLARPLPPPFHHNTPLHHHVANTVRSFTHQESTIDKRFKGHHRFRLAFNVSLPDIEMLKAAELVLNRDSVRLPFTKVNDDKKKHKVLVYDIVKPGVQGISKPQVRLLDSKWVRTSRAGTVHLDVTTAIERWVWRPEQNHGLLVHVLNSDGAPPAEGRPHVRLRRSISDSHHSWQARQPVLLAYTDDGRARLQKPQATEAETTTKRRTRGAHQRNRPKIAKDYSCKRRALYVDFEDVGWNDWIVAPPGYEAYYCQGECPFPLADHLNVTNHALVQTLVNSVNPQAVPRACCVPTSLSSMSMLYMEDGKVILKNYQDMAVEGCGCR